MSENLTFKTRQELRTWLSLHGNSSEGIWIIFEKAEKSKTCKASEALCFGWIDGQLKRIDEQSYKKYFSRRRKNSKWSSKNKALVIELVKKGLMTQEGQAKIDEAKASGEWEKDNEIVMLDEDLELLNQVLKGIEPAYTHFLAMSLSVKKTYTKAYCSAKTSEGKQKRLAWIIDRLNKNLKPM